MVVLVLILSLGACTDAEVEPAEPEVSEFVASCLNAVPEATEEMCTCAVDCLEYEGDGRLMVAPFVGRGRFVAERAEAWLAKA